MFVEAHAFCIELTPYFSVEVCQKNSVVIAIGCAPVQETAFKVLEHLLVILVEIEAYDILMR